MAVQKNKDIEEEVRERFLIAIDELINGPGNLTVTYIMESVGDHQQSLSLFRNGRRYPTIKNIVMLCCNFGYSETWLLFGTGAKKKTKEKDPLKRLEQIEEDVKQLKKKLMK